MNYDLRVIWLEKIQKENSLTSFRAEYDESWICLGHYDMIWIEQLNIKGTPLDTVWEHTRKPHREGSNYRYPLYILHQFCKESNKEQEQFTRFWEQSSIYTTVARLHCNHTNDENHKTLINLLIKHCREEKKLFKVQEYSEQGFVELTVYPDRSIEVSVQVVFYESLELGDLVVISKGNSINAILSFQRDIFECNFVSDIYTYCGIAKWVFQRKNDFETVLEQYPVLNNTYLAYASTRFSVQNAKDAQEFLRTDNFLEAKPHYFVTGTADIVIEWSDSEKSKISEKDFLTCIYHIISQEKVIHSAFRDVITRIGLDYTYTHSSPQENMQYILPMSEELHNELCDKDSPYSWGLQFLKILDTMKTMLKDSVMDDLAKLLYPGIRALIQRLEYLIVEQTGKNIGWQASYDKQILSFMNEWTSFINDIIHLEVQLVQHPELSPARYFIPAMILHFEQQWVIECAETIQEIDKVLDFPSQNYKFQPILIPTTIDNASTICILDPWNDKEYSKQVPLRIRLPIDKLYQPWETAHILCHELAHYCSNAIRDREKRLKCLMNCAINFMLGVVYKQMRGSSVDTQKMRYYHASAFSQLKMLMIDHINESYLSQVEINLPNAIWNLASNPFFQDEYREYLFQGLSADEQKRSFLNAIKQNQMKERISYKELYTDHIIYCLIDLCRECYADIVMILTLHCSFKSYYKCVFQKEFTSLEDNDDMLEVAENHINRMALVVLTICDPNIEGEEWYRSYTPKESLGQESLLKVQKWLEQTQQPTTDKHYWYKNQAMESEGSWAYLYASEAEDILEYLKSCASEFLKCMAKKSDKLTPLRTIIGKVAEQSFDWNEIRSYTESHDRNTILEETDDSQVEPSTISDKVFN